MTTKLQFISDIELALTQGAPSDDLNLEQDQIAYWINDVLNDLKRKEIIAEKAKGKSIPPIYIVRETGLELTEEEVEDIDDENQRMYIELEGSVLDLPNDGGIVKVLDYDLNLIRKTSVEDLEDTKNLRFAKPSADNVLHYREGTKIFIEGLATSDIEYNPFIVDYVLSQDIIAMDDDDEILMSDQLANIVGAQVIATGKQQLYGTQIDESNDGTDSKNPAYHLMINNGDQPTNQPQQ